MSFRLLRQQNTLSRCALRIPRESGSSFPVKSVNYDEEIPVLYLDSEIECSLRV
jgi:hypothetical protein